MGIRRPLRRQGVCAEPSRRIDGRERKRRYGERRPWNAHSKRMNDANSVVHGVRSLAAQLSALTATTGDGAGRRPSAVVAHWMTKRPPGDTSVRRPSTATPTRKTVAEMDLVVFLPLLIILGAFMFFASRRQKKAMQATIDLHDSLTIGDRINTTSGPTGHHHRHLRRQRRPGDRAGCGHHVDEAGGPRPHRGR